MPRPRASRSRSGRSTSRSGAPDAEPVDAPEPFLTTEDASSGAWANAVQLLDDVEDALSRSGRALEVHLQVAQVEQRHRARLLELGERVVQAAKERGIALPADLAAMVEDTEQLRLGLDAARQLALSLTRDSGEPREEEVTQVFTDRLS